MDNTKRYLFRISERAKKLGDFLRSARSALSGMRVRKATLRRSALTVCVFFFAGARMCLADMSGMQFLPDHLPQELRPFVEAFRPGGAGNAAYAREQSLPPRSAPSSAAPALRVADLSSDAARLGAGVGSVLSQGLEKTKNGLSDFFSGFPGHAPMAPISSALPTPGKKISGVKILSADEVATQFFPGGPPQELRPFVDAFHIGGADPDAHYKKPPVFHPPPSALPGSVSYAAVSLRTAASVGQSISEFILKGWGKTQSGFSDFVSQSFNALVPQASQEKTVTQEFVPPAAPAPLSAKSAISIPASSTVSPSPPQIPPPAPPSVSVVTRVTEIVRRSVEPVAKIVTAPFGDQQFASLSATVSSLADKITSQQSALDAQSRMISLANRINNISNVTFTSSNNSFNLTDADIPNDITASNYLPLAGGTITGSVTGTNLTLSGTLTVSGAQTLSGALAVPYFTATSTTATSTIAYGATFATSGGAVGIGTTSPVESLSTAGRLYVGGTGTSTVENNLNVRGNLKIGTSSVTITDTTLQSASSFTISTQGDASHLSLQTLGRVGISSSTPWGVLSVEHNSANASMPIFVVSQQGTSSPFLLVDYMGNVGIGTSSPRSLFSVQGNLYTAGTGFFGNTLTATSTVLLATVSGNVGIGTTSPAQLLSVAGHCVTGDTLLKRRRRRKKADGTYEDEFDDVRIDEIKEGDEILTLDEHTGTLVWSRVNALMDMGTKPIYKLTTASGKTIRTTAEHPYLVRNQENKKPALGADSLGASSVMLKMSPGLPTFNHYTRLKNAVKSVFVDNFETLEVGGIEPPGPWMAIPDPHHATPRAHSLYQSVYQVATTRDGLWTKVQYLSEGMEIAVMGDDKRTAIWDRIVSIEHLPAEQVYDIEVEGTHNFVAGHYVNTRTRTALTEDQEAVIALRQNLELGGWRLEEDKKLHVLAVKYNITINQKTAEIAVLGDPTAEGRNSRSATSNRSIAGGKSLSSAIIHNLKTVEIEGVAPSGSWWQTWMPLLSTPTAYVSYQSGDFVSMENVRILLQALSSKLQVPELNEIEFGGIVAHNTYLTGGLGIGKATTTSNMLDVVSNGVFGGFLSASTFNATSTTATSTFSTGGLTVGTSQFVVQQTSGNVGIGTTDPSGSLTRTLEISGGGGNNGGTLSLTNEAPLVSGVLGTIDFFNAANLQVQLEGRQDGATDSGVFTIDTRPTGGVVVERMRVTSTGNVGIGTTSPAQLLSIAGHCVTGDTRLRRRRKKKKNANGEWEYDYDEVMIKDIQRGDEIASLDETTGQIVWSKVNALMDMGVKQTYKLTTADGRIIRTTAEHPYLVQQIGTRAAKHASPIEGAGWLTVSKLTTDDYIAVPRTRGPRTYAFIDLSNLYHGAQEKGRSVNYAALHRYLSARFGVSQAFIFGGTSENPERIKEYEWMTRIGYTLRLVPTRRRNDGGGKADVDSRMTFEMMRMKDEYDRAVVITGDGDFYWVLEYLKAEKERVWLLGMTSRTARDLKQLFRSNYTDITDISDLFVSASSAIAMASSDQMAYAKQKAEDSRPSASLPATDPFAVSAARMNPSYTHVENMSSAVVDNQMAWVQVSSIEPVAAEQVYDIEVEGTHNFIGNDIVAHNTYLTGGLGAGTAETGNGNITGTGRLSITSTTATSTFSTGGLTVGTSQFVVQQTSGNVGIGTTNPGTMFHIQSLGSPRARIETTGAGSVGLDFITTGSSGGTISIQKFNNEQRFQFVNGGTRVLQVGTGGGLSLGSSYAMTDPGDGSVLVSGNVGIGTTSPSQTLAVHGNTLISGNLTVAGITATGTVTFNNALTVGNGGTGNTTFTSSNLLYGNGTTALQSVATSSIANGTNITVTNGSSAYVIGSQPTINISGTIGVTNGGLGINTVADGALLFGGIGGGTAALTALATSTGGTILQTSFATGRPSWVATSTLNIALSNTTGTLAINRGGTNATSFTSGQPIAYDGTSLISTSTLAVNVGGTGATTTPLWFV